MTLKDRALLKRFGLRAGPDFPLTAALALAQRIEALESPLAELERERAGSRLRRFFGGVSDSP